MSEIVKRVDDRPSSSVPRRDALKRVGTIVAAAAALVKGKSIIAAASELPSSPLVAKTRPVPRTFTGPTKVLRKVTLEVGLPSGNRTLLHLPDTFPGGIATKSGSVTIVPKLSKNEETVEVAIYRGKRDEMSSSSLVHTMTLDVVHSSLIGSIKSVPIGISALPISGFAAFWAGATEVAADYSPDCDCSVKCCDGTTASACGVCCDVNNSDCGSCCDSGCCPGCPPPV